MKPPSQPLIILHSAASDSGKAAAEHLASRLGLASDQIATGAAADAVPRAMIRFYSADEHPLARRLGNELAQMGYAWQIENFAERPRRPAIKRLRYGFQDGEAVPMSGHGGHAWPPGRASRLKEHRSHG